MEIHVTRFADTKATKDPAKRYVYICIYTLLGGTLNIEMFKLSTVVKAHSVCSIKSALFETYLQKKKKRRKADIQ